jgi:pimeloyl-ACP methyl ester carboxylesterase
VAPVTDGVVGKLIDLVLFPTDKKKQDMMHWTLGDNPAVLDEFSDQMMLSMNAEGKMAIPREFSAEELSAIKCPVYLFLGDKDGPIGPPAKAIERARAIPHLSYQVLTGTGHIMNFEQADEVNARLLEFLAGKKK